MPTRRAQLDEAVRGLTGARWLDTDARQERINRAASFGADAVPSLARLLGRSDITAHRDIVRALVEIGPEAVGPLRGLLRHRRDAVRAAAVSVLAGIGTSDALDAAREGLRGATGRHWTRRCVGLAISITSVCAFVVAGGVALWHIHHGNHSVWASQAPVLINGPLALLSLLATDRYASFKTGLIRCFAGTTDPAIVALIASCLADTNDRTRAAASQAAVDALAVVGASDAHHFGREALDGLASAVLSDDASLRGAALAALSKVGDGRAVRAVRECAKALKDHEAKQQIEGALPAIEA